MLSTECAWGRDMQSGPTASGLRALKPLSPPCQSMSPTAQLALVTSGIFGRGANIEMHMHSDA